MSASMGPWSLLWFAACGTPETRDEPGAPPPVEAAPPPHGKPEVTADLLADRAAVRHPSDGGGTVALADPGPLTVGGPGRFALTYTAGPLGVEPGGAVVFQSPPFWGWSEPQLRFPEAVGFTTVTQPEGLSGTPLVAPGGTLVIPVEGRALREGERIEVVYGEGRGSRVDRFAEGAERLWFAVDGDGDGVRKWVADPPVVRIAAGPPARLHCVWPSTVEPGHPVEARISVLDALGNATGAERDVRVAIGGEVRDHRVVGTRGVPWTPVEPGIYRLRATSGDLSCTSNPLVVREGAPRIQWMDLQVHTAASDGTGTLDEVYRYGRDIAGLDGMAITDHDHWGMAFLDADPETWARMVERADHYDAPDFVVPRAYEWTSWTHGHRHVLLFEHIALKSSLDPASDTPRELAEPFAIPHHPAGGPVAVDWETAASPRVVEITSVHGSSEAPDTPGPIYDPVPGSYVRDALDRGMRFGFVGSTDGHDGHPGLSQLAGPHGGLAAIVDAGPGREGLRDALERRSTYATNGPRILLNAHIGAHRMGAVLPASDGLELEVRVVAESPLAAVELVRAGAVVASRAGGGAVAFERFELPALRAGEYAYVRVIQSDGGAAWSSPFFFE